MKVRLNIVSNNVDQSWTVSEIAAKAVPETWKKVFEESKNEIQTISEVLVNDEAKYGRGFYPLKKDLFAAFSFTPLDKVKVVIFGQDPYPQSILSRGKVVPRAKGLSFSVDEDDDIPSSLKNIYKEMLTVPGFLMPDHGDLTEWTSQGILLLNTCLTVRAEEKDTHGQIWLGFIRRVLKAIDETNPRCIYLLWGKHAQKIKPLIGEKGIILEAAHPSGLSAARGFFGCDHFNKVNKILLEQGKNGINWKISTRRELNNMRVSRPS